MQLRAFAPVSGWVAPSLDSLPQDWRGMRVSLDTETRDPQLLDLGPGVRRDGYVVGISLAFQPIWGDPERSRCVYLPIRHEGGGNLDQGRVLEYLRDRGAEFDGDLVGANLGYDLDYLAERGILFPRAKFRDVQVAEPLLDELQFSYSLAAIAERNGVVGKEETLLEQAARHFCGHLKRGSKKWSPKSHLWSLPAKHVGPYAEADALSPLVILASQERRLRATDAADPRVQAGRARSLWSLWEMESELLPILVDMRRRGVRVDLGHLDVVEASCVRETAAACSALSTAVGVRIEPSDVNKPAFMGPIIEKVVGALPRTARGQVELQKKKLQALHHPTVDLYLRARKFDKLRTSFVASVRAHAIGDRVHCTFNQLKRGDDGGGDDSVGTISGRLSSTDFNIQQMPIQDDLIGPLWRRLFLPDEGAEWACLDLSQQEARWLVHFAAESRCDGAEAARARLRADPETDFYELLRDQIGWTGDEGRQKAKTIYLGLAYGMQGRKLSRQLGVETKWIKTRAGRLVEVAGDAAQAVLDRFFSGAPFLRQLPERASSRAEESGFVRTVLGRVCRFPRRRDGGPGYDDLHKATNRIVQGSSADQTKMAMVLAAREGIKMQIQVHDELDLSVGSRNEAIRLAEIMLSAVPCTVPHLVRPEIGPSWGETERFATLSR